MTALEVALTYIGRGWNPVPVPYRSKKPVDDEWQQRVITAETARTILQRQAAEHRCADGADIKRTERC